MGQYVPILPENDAAIGHRLSEWLLIETLNDIEKRSEPGADLYTLLGIAAGLRRILIDKRPLIHLARARLRIAQPEFAFTPFELSAGEKPGWNLVLGFAKAGFTEPSTSMRLSDFRRAACGQHERSLISVDATIKYFANVHGGVHAGAPENDLERDIQRFAVSLDSAGIQWANVLRHIGMVTCRALQPTKNAILSNPASNAPPGSRFPAT